ncbi:MAG: hypothetical protein KDA61_10435, partial [Planctomycetales bacterium]|nr:hypothetical protein [Planctomycetales bacterium]
MGMEGGEMMMGRGRGMEGGMGGMMDEEDDEYLVQWLDQGELQVKLAFPRQPTSLQIWVTQEDLWVYETLLGVIARTNEAAGATRPDNAAIRVIAQLQVGSEAAMYKSTPGNIYLPVSGGMGMGEMGMGMEGGEMMGRGGGEMMMGRGGGEMMGRGGYGDENVDPDAMLLTNRYLGPDGEASSAEIDELLSSEYRRLPVHMSLMMKDQMLPRLLIECANAPLPIQVERIQINPDKSAVGFEAASGGRGGMGGGFRGESSSMNMSTMSGGSTLSTVELQGVVYIYNPPDPEILTLPGDEDLAQPVDDGSDVADAPADDATEEVPVDDLG